MTETPDEKVARFIIGRYRDLHPTHHLASCDDAEVIHPEAEDGVYGCDTGCEYTRFTATIRCPHEEHPDFYYGEFGDLASILDEMDRVPEPPAPLLPDAGLTARASLFSSPIGPTLVQWNAEVDGMAVAWTGPSDKTLAVQAYSNGQGVQSVVLVDSATGDPVHRVMRSAS